MWLYFWIKGQKSSSHQYITKIQINSSGNAGFGSGYNSGREKSFSSYQDARKHDYRAVSPASLQYSLTPIAKASNNARANIQYDEIEFVVSSQFI